MHMTIRRHSQIIRTTALTITMVAVASMSTVLQAQPGRPGRNPIGRNRMMMGPAGGPLPGLWTLDLTDDQREMIRDIAAEGREKALDLLAPMREAQQALRDAVTAEVVDEGTIRRLAAEVAGLQADAAVHEADTNAQVWRVLTPTQRDALHEWQASADERRAERLQEQRERRRDRLERRPRR